MRIVVPYAGNFPVQALDALTQVTTEDVETEYVGGNDTDYFDLLARLWREREPFIVVEHDIIVTEAAITGLLECQHAWCSCPYQWYTATLHGLGCSKFDLQIMQDFPDLFDEVAKLNTDMHPARHWCSLDGRIRQYLGRNGVNDHLHSTVVGHLRPYASHGCVVRLL